MSILQHPRIRIYTVPVCPALPKGDVTAELTLCLLACALAGLPKAAFLAYAPFKVALQV